MDLWVRALHVCVGTAACPGTADSSPCVPQAKNTDSYPFKKQNTFLQGKFKDFLTIWLKAPFLAGEKSKKDRNLGDSARGQADPGSAAVYTMDRPGPVICTFVCM